MASALKLPPKYGEGHWFSAGAAPCHRRGLWVAGLRVLWPGVVGWMRLRAQGGGCGIPCVRLLGLFLVGILPRRRVDVLPSGLELRSSDLGPALLADA